MLGILKTKTILNFYNRLLVVFTWSPLLFCNWLLVCRWGHFRVLALLLLSPAASGFPHQSSLNTRHVSFPGPRRFRQVVDNSPYSTGWRTVCDDVDRFRAFFDRVKNCGSVTQGRLKIVTGCPSSLSLPLASSCKYTVPMCVLACMCVFVRTRMCVCVFVWLLVLTKNICIPFSSKQNFGTRPRRIYSRPHSRHYPRKTSDTSNILHSNSTNELTSDNSVNTYTPTY